MADNVVDFDNYLRALDKSVAEDKEREHDKAVYRKGYRKGVNKGFTEGIKRGFIAGAIATILLSGTLVLGVNGIKGYINDIGANNESVEYGYSAVISGTRPATNPGAYWYDYRDIALEYDAEKMDFDSFVYGAFNKIGWNKESTLECMDKLFYQLNLYGYTDYQSFVTYCESKGACETVDGKLVVDTSKYKDLVRDYIQNLNSAEKEQEKIEGFRQGK